MLSVRSEERGRRRDGVVETSPGRKNGGTEGEKEKNEGSDDDDGDEKEEEEEEE